MASILVTPEVAEDPDHKQIIAQARTGSQTGDQLWLIHDVFGNNYMDKLNLPIPGDEGPDRYEGTTLLFERRSDGSFEMTVGSSAEVRS